MTAHAPAGTPVASRRPPPGAVADVVITVLLLALFAGAFLAAGDWSFRAALFPRLVTGAGIVLAALHLVQALLRLRVRRPAPVPAADGAAPDDPGPDDPGPDDPGPDDPGPDDPGPDDTGPGDLDPDAVEYVFRTAGPRRWASSLGWVAGFFVLLYIAGLYVTAPVFSLLYLRFAGKRTWIFSAIYAIVIAVVLYVAFELALGVPTPTGLLLD